MTLSSSHEGRRRGPVPHGGPGDDLDGIRAEASGILQTQYERGSNGYVKSKYVTLTSIPEGTDNSPLNGTGWRPPACP